MIVHISDPKKIYQGTSTTHKNTFSNVAGYNLTQKNSVALLDTDVKWSEKEIR